MLHVSAGILLRDQTVFLAQRPEGKHLAGYWEFPGGKIEPGESPELTLIREFAEEFAVQIAVGSKFHENIHYYADGAVTLHTYLATHVAGAFERCEHAALRWVPVHQLLDYQLAPADIPIAEKLMRRYR
jgi:8-oxo-dGTP diphosphatase